jgi:hypothetical protein
VLVFKQVYQKFGFVNVIFELLKMFLEAHVERFSCLANILHVAIRIGKLVNATFFVLVLRMVSWTGIY